VAVRAAIGSDTAKGQCDGIDSLDFVLTGIQRQMGRASNVRVDEAKKWLRDRGGSSTASLLSKLSKLRNVQAHPLALRILSESAALDGKNVAACESEEDSATDAAIALQRKDVESMSGSVSLDGACVAEHFDIASHAGDDESKTLLADMVDNSSDGDGVVDDTVGSLLEVDFTAAANAHDGGVAYELTASKREGAFLAKFCKQFVAAEVQRVLAFSWQPKPKFNLPRPPEVLEVHKDESAYDENGDDLSWAEEELAAFVDELDVLMKARERPQVRRLIATTAQRFGITPKELLAFVKEAYTPNSYAIE
jgi:hypothetical protein